MDRRRQFLCSGSVLYWRGCLLLPYWATGLFTASRHFERMFAALWSLYVPAGLVVTICTGAQIFYVLPTQCIYVFYVDLRTNSDYFPIQHQRTGFYNRDLTLYSPVVTICTASLTFNNSTFCPPSVFMCFVWISEQTAIISLYSIKGLVFITEI